MAVEHPTERLPVAVDGPHPQLSVRYPSDRYGGTSIVQFHALHVSGNRPKVPAEPAPLRRTDLALLRRHALSRYVITRIHLRVSPAPWRRHSAAATSVHHPARTGRWSGASSARTALLRFPAEPFIPDGKAVGRRRATSGLTITCVSMTRPAWVAVGSHRAAAGPRSPHLERALKIIAGKGGVVVLLDGTLVRTPQRHRKREPAEPLGQAPGPRPAVLRPDRQARQPGVDLGGEAGALQRDHHCPPQTRSPPTYGRPTWGCQPTSASPASRQPPAQTRLTHTTGLHIPVDAGVAAAFLR